jgi:uncharacterized membrane protein YraQ (UPF0718 family)
MKSSVLCFPPWAGHFFPLGRQRTVFSVRRTENNLLLCLLIFIISYIQSYFPPERSKKILGRFRGLGANCIARCWGR